MLTKKEQRLRRARQTRIRIAKQGIARLTVNRTNLHIYASVISGEGDRVLASASTAEKEVRALGQILPDGRHESLGEAPVEGAELQKIMDLARYDGTEMTS